MDRMDRIVSLFLLGIFSVFAIGFLGSLYFDYQALNKIKCNALAQNALFLEQTKDSIDNDVLSVRQHVRQHVKDNLSYCVDN